MVTRVYCGFWKIFLKLNAFFRWKNAAENAMEVQLLETNRHSFVKPERHGSLYDETPLFGNNFTVGKKIKTDNLI